MDTNDLLEADVEHWIKSNNMAKANVIQKIYELLTVSGQLNQTFNLSKYNHNQKWKRKKQTQNSS
jgi:hypothetical protein